MDGLRSMLNQSLTMDRSDIALVVGKTIFGKLLIKLTHNPVSCDLGNDRCSRN